MSKKGYLEHPVIQQIYQDLNLDDEHILNIYNWGSRSYGINTPYADYDFLFVTDYDDPPLQFSPNGQRHEFALYKDEKKELYDVIIYSINNIKELLRRNILYIVECIFLPETNVFKRTVDLRPYYVEVFNPHKLKDAVHFESRHEYWIKNKRWDEDPKKGRKCLFHSLRYLIFGKQVLEHKGVVDFQAANYLFWEIQQLSPNITFKEVETIYNPIRIKLLKEFDNQYYKMTLNVTGIFEYHITIELQGISNSLDEFSSYCNTKKLKPIVIELDKGQYPTQVMTSSYHSNRTYPDNIEEINQMAKELTEAGYKPVRLKIESLASNKGVPEDEEQHSYWPTHCYFEFHFKVPVVDSVAYQELNRLCQLKGAHLSRNAFKKPTVEDPMSYYYVTLRCFKGGRVQAFSECRKLRDVLRSAGYKGKKVEREFVVYDSNLELDAGWSTHNEKSNNEPLI